jgi:hypothetical protein
MGRYVSVRPVTCVVRHRAEGSFLPPLLSQYMAPGLYGLPISQRPSLSWHGKLNGLLWCVAFNVGCLMVHGFQVVFLLPLRALPFQWSRKLYDRGICYTKGAFGCLLSPLSLASLLNYLTQTAVFMCQWFAPTKLRLTFEQKGKGRFSQADIDSMAVKDQNGKLVYLNLPTKSVLISNHQVRSLAVPLHFCSFSL